MYSSNSNIIDILLVDDDEFQRCYFKQELEEEGYRVSLAGDGWQALEEIAKEKPEVVVMDVVMPRMDGIQTLYGIKCFYPTLPVILHSNHPNYKNNYLCWMAEDIVTKSADTAYLRQALKKLLLEPLNNVKRVLQKS